MKKKNLKTLIVAVEVRDRIPHEVGDLISIEVWKQVHFQVYLPIRLVEVKNDVRRQIMTYRVNRHE